MPSPFPCSPVIRERLRKKTQIEKNFLWGRTTTLSKVSESLAPWYWYLWCCFGFLASKYPSQNSCCPNKVAFNACSTFILIRIATTYFLKPVNIAPNAPATTEIIIIFFMPQILAISSLSILYFSVFPASFSFTRTSPGMVTPTILISFSVLLIIKYSRNILEEL